MAEDVFTGLVEKSTGSWYKVRCNSGERYDCKIKGKFRMADLKSTNPIAVGDMVDFTLENDNTGVIITIHQRKNAIIRKASNLSKQSHILASNVDQALLTVTLRQPRTLTNFVDRFLVSAEAYDIPVIIVINKIDILKKKDEAELNEWVDMYTSCGYKVVTTSVIDNIGLDTVKELLRDKTTVLSGNSGVGKSSMINAIDSTLELKTKEVSKSHRKGQHTTTYAELYPLAFGGNIIDTPGVKAFGLLDMQDDNIGHYFPEMRNLMHLCQYNNCTHLHEPNCAVMEAVAEGIIHVKRYESYIAMVEDANEKHRKGH
jgi:ribosome biogenesis GTPase / thiamine phosphate phosphatase